jgi:hypothetical protein
MPESPKADLHRYLQAARDALLWKLDGLSEYDVRRPIVPTGTNLLGLVKHVASVEFGYFGDTVSGGSHGSSRAERRVRRAPLPYTGSRATMECRLTREDSGHE